MPLSLGLKCREMINQLWGCSAQECSGARLLIESAVETCKPGRLTSCGV